MSKQLHPNIPENEQENIQNAPAQEQDDQNAWQKLLQRLETTAQKFEELQTTKQTLEQQSQKNRQDTEQNTKILSALEKFKTQLDEYAETIRSFLTAKAALPLKSDEVNTINKDISALKEKLSTATEQQKKLESLDPVEPVVHAQDQIASALTTLFDKMQKGWTQANKKVPTEFATFDTVASKQKAIAILEENLVENIDNAAENDEKDLPTLNEFYDEAKQIREAIETDTEQQIKKNIKETIQTNFEEYIDKQLNPSGKTPVKKILKNDKISSGEEEKLKKDLEAHVKQVIDKATIHEKLLDKNNPTIILNIYQEISKEAQNYDRSEEPSQNSSQTNVQPNDNLQKLTDFLFKPNAYYHAISNYNPNETIIESLKKIEKNLHTRATNLTNTALQICENTKATQAIKNTDITDFKNSILSELDKFNKENRTLKDTITQLTGQIDPLQKQKEAIEKTIETDKKTVQDFDKNAQANLEKLQATKLDNPDLSAVNNFLNSIVRKVENLKEAPEDHSKLTEQIEYIELTKPPYSNKKEQLAEEKTQLEDDLNKNKKEIKDNEENINTDSQKINRIFHSISLLSHLIVIKNKQLSEKIETSSTLSAAQKAQYQEALSALPHKIHQLYLDFQNSALPENQENGLYFINEFNKVLSAFPPSIQDKFLSELPTDVTPEMKVLLKDPTALGHLIAAIQQTKVFGSTLTTLQSLNPYAFSNYINPEIIALGSTHPGNPWYSNSGKTYFGSVYLENLLAKHPKKADHDSLMEDLLRLSDTDLTDYDKVQQLRQLLQKPGQPLLQELDRITQGTLSYREIVEEQIQQIETEKKLLDVAKKEAEEATSAFTDTLKSEHKAYVERLTTLEKFLDDHYQVLKAEKTLLAQYTTTLSDRTDQLKQALSDDHYQQRLYKGTNGIYIVSSTTHIEKTEQYAALKSLLPAEKAPEPDTGVYDADDLDRLLPKQEEKEQKNTFRAANRDQTLKNANPVEIETITLYSDQLGAHKKLFEDLSTQQPIDEQYEKNQLSAMPPTEIQLHPANSGKFKHVHSTVNHYPDKKTYCPDGTPKNEIKTAEARWKEARVHTALELATRDLEKRIGNDDPKDFLKTAKLVIYTKKLTQAKDLCTAYLMVLENKYGLSRAKALETITVAGLPAANQFKPADVYISPYRKKLSSDCADYFNSDKILEAYGMSTKAEKVIIMKEQLVQARAAATATQKNQLSPEEANASRGPRR